MESVAASAAAHAGLSLEVDVLLRGGVRVQLRAEGFRVGFAGLLDTLLFKRLDMWHGRGLRHSASAAGRSCGVCTPAAVCIVQIRVDDQLRLAECVLHGIEDGVVDEHAVGEAHLELLRVHVHVDDLRIHVDHQHDERELVLHEEGTVAVLDGLHDHRVLHEALVHEVELEVAVRAGDDGLSDEATDGDRREPGEGRALVGTVHGDELVRDVAAVDRVDYVQERAIAERREELAAVLQVAEGDLRVGQCFFLQDILDPGSFGLRTFQELAASRDIFKEVPDDEGRAVGCADLGEILLDAAFDLVMYSHEGARGLRDQLDAGDTRDGGEGLTAEAEGLDAEEVAGVADLRGGMADEGVAHVLLGDAAAVVRHANHGDAAVADLDRYRGAAGIDGVLEELLHDTERPLDHLARRNLIDGLIT